ncbi:MAG: hypothetical protein IJF40_06955 [Clostridia bacterium]|nr:hypothetical protein [Clostridia bacterium]MBQ7047192.1 hypothetical protein [Oscillospiraceae bacterium]
MFFGPFLPLVPLLFALEMLPESIGEPVQASILSIAYYLGSGFDGILNFILK